MLLSQIQLEKTTLQAGTRTSVDTESTVSINDDYYKEAEPRTVQHQDVTSSSKLPDQGSSKILYVGQARGRP